MFVALDPTFPNEKKKIGEKKKKKQQTHSQKVKTKTR